MPPREPDKHIFHTGGAMPKKTTSALFKKVSNALPKKSAALNAKAATKKAATKEASVENVLIQEGAITVPTESRKSTLQIATNMRVAAKKQKGKQRQVAINRTRKAAALAAKKAANLAVVVRRSTITQQQQQTTSDDRTRRTQLLITAIKAKGKKRSIQKLTEARAKLKSKISVDKTDASFALTSRLDRINNSRLNTLIPSKRAEIGDIEVVAAANHGTGLNSLKKSNDIITDADTKRTNAGNDTLAQISRNAQLDIDITNQHLPDRVKDLQDAGTTLSNDNAICANAAKNADTALILSSIKSTTEIPARIAYLNAATDNLVIPIKLKAAKELSDAAASRGIADIHDINRQITMDSANSRIKDQGVVDTQRKSAGADVATHTKELSDANLKKAANDENLTTIQKTHQNTIAGMEANADTSVGTFKKNLDDISAAASDQGGTVSKATKVRSDKEGEQVKNTSDIDSKKQEIQKALDNESTARADHDTSQKLIDDTSKNLDQQVQTTIPIKSDRDAADVDTKSHYPTHNPVDQKMVDRKDAIQNTEIPAQQKALDAAKKDLDIATTDIKDPKAHRAVNDVELATMPAQHSTLVANDVSLHSRSDAATTALNDAAAHRSDVAANIKSRQTVGQAHRVHSDDIQNVIDTHFQERSTGVSMVSDKDLNASVLSKRFDSSSSELTAATAHIAALPPFVASKKHMSDLGNLLETESTEITRLNGIRYELGATIPKENINLAMLDASRGSVPSRIAHTKAEAEIATTKANEVLPTLQDIDQNLEWANMGLDYYSSPPIKPVRDKIEKNTNLAGDAGKVVADINPLRIDAFNTAAKCHSDQLNADTGRSSSAHDADTFTGLQDTAGNNKIRNETALNGIEAKHRSDMEQMHSDTDGMVSSTKRHLDDASAAGLDQAGKASNATTVRSNKENEATTQGAETSKMLKEVGDASVNEGLAKMDHDTRLADISKTQSSLDTLVASEPTIKADRLQASSIAEASRPVHDPVDITLKNRKDQINGAELPAAVNTHDTAVGKHDSVVSDLNSSSGPIAMKRAHIEELDNLTTKNSGLTNNDGALHAKLNMESNTIDSLKNKREVINETIISGNEVINTRAQDMDKVQNLIDAKNLEIRLAEPPLQMLHNIDIEKATATFEMDSGSRQHAISEGGLNTSKANIKGENGLLNTLGDDTTKLKKTQDDLNASITAETGNAHTHQIEIDTALQHKKDIQKNADNASSSADNALTNQHNTIDEIAGMQHTKDDIGLGILSEKDKIKKETGIAEASAVIAVDANIGRNTSNTTAAKCHSDQLNADTGRSSSAHDADTFTGLQDTAGNNKIRNETALNGIEAKHRSDMEQMHSDTDGMVSSTKRHLDDASAAGLDQAGKASNATTVRSNKENEATTQGAETSKMLKEVGDASVNEGLAKMDHDTRLADISKTQSSLDTLVASEPTIKADRLQASSIAEASRPVHDPVDITLKNRKDQINGAELPAAVNTHDTAVGKHDSVVSDLNSSSGPIAMKRAHIEELDNLTTKNSGLTNNDGALHAKLNMESNTIDSLKNKREVINETIISGNEVINTRAQDMDKVQNLIDAKNLEIRLAEPPLQMLHNIDIEKATATFEMDSGSRQHAISEGGLNTSKANIKGENGLLNTLGDDTTKLKKTQDDLNASITAETGNAHTHQIEIDTALQHKKDIQKNADNASSSADNALTNQHNTIDEIAGMQHTKDDIGLGILSEKDKIKKETGIAEASAVIAVDANIGRNTSNTTVKKSKEELDNTVAEINGEAVNAEANADAADRARRNKLAADADLDAIKQTHKDMISVMETDANGAVVKHAKELDDANGSTGPQNDTVIGSRKKRKEAEDDSVQNESDIVSKNGEVSKAHDRELSAKNQHDADLTNVGAHRKDLDDLFTDEPVRKKDRDDAEADADNNIPEHDPNAQKLKKRQDEIDGEIADLNPIKDKAEIEKQRAIDDLKSKKAEKSALPPQDDTTGLKADHDRIQKELDDEIKRKKELNDQEKVVKTHKEQSADVILAKQLLAGTISAQILAIINASIGPALFPIPTPPTIIQAFTYPLPSTASGATTSGPVESGPTIIAALTSGAGDNPSVITQLTIPTSVGIDLSSGPSGPIILSDYQRGYNNGTIAGNRDGTTDATADANNAFSNKESETLLKIKAQIGLLETAKQTNIDTAVAAAAQDAYCNEVQTQGTKGGIDIFKAFSECSAYFNRVKIFPSGPTIVQPPVYTEGSLSVSGAAESGAAKESGASELLSGGGYQEDLSGVMQFSGALTSGPATPSEEYDSGYVDGYRAAYKGIYITIFSLTLAINITKNPPKTIPLGYNESGAAETEESGAAETEESGAAETEESGAAEEKSSGPKIVTEADSVKPKISSVPITQQGGFLKLAKRHHKRGRTLMQHARLLDKIVGKTTAGRNS